MTATALLPRLQYAETVQQEKLLLSTLVGIKGIPTQFHRSDFASQDQIRKLKGTTIIPL